jgi:hypothetical protein
LANPISSSMVGKHDGFNDDLTRISCLPLAAARRCCVLTNFFLVDNQSLSLQSLVCAFY